MAAIDFPASPTLNQTFTSSGITWQWNGTTWDNISVNLGQQGFQGPIGAQGNTGAQGFQGRQGPVGAQGNQGPAGPQGNTGAQGFQGPVGAQGSTGAQGFQGRQGPAGPQGNTGAQGFQGPNSVGPTGPQGFQGPTGGAGPTGPQGFQGRQGPAGSNGGAGPTGPQGFQGPSGGTGGTGPQGFQGRQGPAGSNGGAGPTGPQGFQGPSGGTGGTGPQGFQGRQGPAGPNGGTGGTGPQGFQGPSGGTGGTGPQGFQGRQGPSGPNVDTLQSVTDRGFTTSQSIAIGQGSAAGETYLNIGANKSVNSPAYIDFQTRASTTQDFDFRILKNSGGSGVVDIRNVGGTLQIVNDSADIVLIGTSNTSRVQVLGNGRVLIGTTTDSGDLLRVEGSISTSTGSIRTPAATLGFYTQANAAMPIQAASLLCSSNYGDQTNVPTNGAYIAGVIRGGNDIVAYYSSDKRLKENIVKIDEPLDKISKIGGYSFDWNNKQDTYTGHDYGVIAQEIEEILPELVTTRSDGYKAVKYEKIIPLLIESIKELKAELDILKNK